MPSYQIVTHAWFLPVLCLVSGIITVATSSLVINKGCLTGANLTYIKYNLVAGVLVLIYGLYEGYRTFMTKPGEIAPKVV
jgi:hypothetical protein